MKRNCRLRLHCVIHIIKTCYECIANLIVKEVAALERKKKKQHGFGWSRIWMRDRELYAMCLAPLVMVVVFRYLPIYGIVMAFERYTPSKGFFHSEFVGLKYFIQFFRDPFCFRIIKNTVLLSLYSLLWTFPAPILLALLLNEIRHARYKKLVQTVTYLPHFISVVILVGLMKELFSSVDGIVNRLIVALGGSAVNFFSEPGWFRSLYIGSSLWQGVGYGSIIYLAALAGIDMEQYEAARIDGANRLQKILYITLPGIMPTTVILLIMRMGSLFSNDFQKILLMYSPATYSTADVISTYTYRYGLENSNYSYAAAIGLMLSVISFVFVWGANAFSKKVSENSLW